MLVIVLGVYLGIEKPWQTVTDSYGLISAFKFLDIGSRVFCSAGIECLGIGQKIGLIFRHIVFIVFVPNSGSPDPASIFDHHIALVGFHVKPECFFHGAICCGISPIP